MELSWRSRCIWCSASSFLVVVLEEIVSTEKRVKIILINKPIFVDVDKFAIDYDIIWFNRKADSLT